MAFSIWHWLILIIVAAFLIGNKATIAGFMDDLADGIRKFKESAGLMGPNAPQAVANVLSVIVFAVLFLTIILWTVPR